MDQAHYRKAGRGAGLGRHRGLPQHRRQAPKGLGYRLRANAKKLNRQKDPGRDSQFAYIATMREAFTQAGLPVVSVDAKHRELVGEFKNPGRPG